MDEDNPSSEWNLGDGVSTGNIGVCNVHHCALCGSEGAVLSGASDTPERIGGHQRVGERPALVAEAA